MHKWVDRGKEQIPCHKRSRGSSKEEQADRISTLSPSTRLSGYFKFWIAPQNVPQIKINTVGFFFVFFFKPFTSSLFPQTWNTIIFWSLKFNGYHSIISGGSGGENRVSFICILKPTLIQNYLEIFPRILQWQWLNSYNVELPSILLLHSPFLGYSHKTNNQYILQLSQH